MGRVKRYKKFKACDPFAKRGKVVIDTTHDEPPELFEERKSGKKRKERFVSDEDEYEKYLRRDSNKIAKKLAEDVRTFKVICHFFFYQQFLPYF